MTVQEDHNIVSTERSASTGLGRPVTSETFESRRVTSTPSGSEFARRAIVLVFGLIQLVVVLRIMLLLVDARTGNDIVSGILNISQVFVAPFEGILRSDALHAGRSTLDMAAVVALIGWTVLEAIILWIVGMFRRERITA